MLRRSVFGSLAALFLPAVVGNSVAKPSKSVFIQGAKLKSVAFDIDTPAMTRVIEKALKSTGFMMPDGTKLFPFDNSVDDSDWYNVSSSG